MCRMKRVMRARQSGEKCMRSWPGMGNDGVGNGMGNSGAVLLEGRGMEGRV